MTIDRQHLDNRWTQTLEIFHGLHLLHYRSWNTVLSQVKSAAYSPKYSPAYGPLYGPVYCPVYGLVYGPVYGLHNYPKQEYKIKSVLEVCYIYLKSKLYDNSSMVHGPVWSSI